MRLIAIIIALLATSSLKAQIPDSTWRFESHKRFQVRYRMDTIRISDFTKVDHLGPSLPGLGNKTDSIVTIWTVDTTNHILYRSWIWKGKTRKIKFEYVSWENYETSDHDPRYLKGAVYFHTKGRGNIEWHPGEMVVWDNIFLGFRIEYLK